jgi:hypothetical protein
MLESVVNKNERDAFIQSIQYTRYAGIEQVQNIFWTIPISAHRKEFILGKRGQRDGQRAALFMEAAKLKNAAARLLAFYISVSKAGFRGTVCTEDVLAAQVVQATGGLCAPRTFRRALAECCRRGWLLKEPMATGTKIPTPGGWKTLQVNKITIPYCTRLLGLKRHENYQKKPQEIEFTGKTGVPGTPEIAPPDASPTPAKMANNGSKKAYAPPSKGGASSLILVNVKDKPVARNEVAELTTAQPGTASPSPTSPPLKHLSDSKARSAGKSQPKRCDAPFARRSRSKILRTWQNGRVLFLHDLRVQLGASDVAGASGASDVAGASFEARIAEVQTDLLYPPLFPVALDWEKYVPRWLELDWKERRRILLREVLPALRAWCAPWRCPSNADLGPAAPPAVRAAAEEQLAQYQRVAAIMKSLPDMLTNKTTPRWVCEKVNEHRWQLQQLPILITLGRMGLDELRPGELQAFREIADLLGLER